MNKLSMAAFFDYLEARSICKEIEAFCPFYGFHVLLTGGCLYKEGPRKDLDIGFYRINLLNKMAPVDGPGLINQLRQIGFTQLKAASDYHIKGFYRHRPVDIMFPLQIEDLTAFCAPT